DLETHENTNNRGTTSKLSDLAYSQLTEYFEGQRKVFDFPYKMQGTDFQKKVWKALCDIPYGETRSYKDIAIVVGNPKASRAVGMANNRNRLLFVVPCHRVIGANGSLVGYAGGLEMKTTLLELERKYKDKL
ncbi:methylated-DNA--[protein]-cysteine S-methyltransferase, partial [Clostridium perfringens]|nr:methylated-DNA--[protein]-cysteine S-methyltransferase [Clostridium perfringens]